MCSIVLKCVFKGVIYFLRSNIDTCNKFLYFWIISWYFIVNTSWYIFAKLKLVLCKPAQKFLVLTSATCDVHTIHLKLTRSLNQANSIFGTLSDLLNGSNRRYKIYFLIGRLCMTSPPGVDDLVFTSWMTHFRTPPAPNNSYPCRLQSTWMTRTTPVGTHYIDRNIMLFTSTVKTSYKCDIVL